MKVTKIQIQVKRGDRYSIYIDEKYAFSLSEYQLAGAGLFIGKEFTQKELDTFLEESNFGKAYERALNYVMIRPRSEKEIKDYLTRTFMYPKARVFTDKEGRRTFKKAAIDVQKVQVMIERILERLKQRGYIDDENFAKRWITSRQLTKNSSKRRLQQELRIKGIDEDITATVLQNDEGNELENLKAVIVKKQRSARYHDKKKLLAYLLRQGFNYDDVLEVLETETTTD